MNILYYLKVLERSSHSMVLAISAGLIAWDAWWSQWQRWISNVSCLERRIHSL